MAKKINIIGAGIAGLSAGCYLSMNGYDTEIFEMHTLPGGLCTSWKRNNYVFDGCIYIFLGSSPAHNLYYLWNEIIDMKKVKFFDYREYVRIEDKSGQFISVRTNVDELEQELLEKAPEDKKLIKTFIKVIRQHLHMEMLNENAPETSNFLERIKMKFKSTSYLRLAKKWSQTSALEIAKKCKNPLLARMFSLIIGEESNIWFLIMVLAWQHKKCAGYPIGGSLEFARLMEKKYLELGGKIHYNSRVKKIITSDNTAKGVLLENDQEHLADIVISAADSHATVFDMLEGKYTDKKILESFENKKTSSSFVLVSFGISRTFPEDSHTYVFPLEQPLVIDPDTSCHDLGAAVCNFDPTLAPEGKTVVQCLFTTSNYKYWVDLRKNNKDKYDREKTRISNEIIEILEKKFGDIKSRLEVTDISTPATVIRYTNNWKGSMQAWAYTPVKGMEPMKKTLPGLDNFYMAGHWLEFLGGLPPALTTAREVSQMICEKDNKTFTTKAANY